MNLPKLPDRTTKVSPTYFDRQWTYLVKYLNTSVSGSSIVPLATSENMSGPNVRGAWKRGYNGNRSEQVRAIPPETD
jgi:hypothetical protein